MDSRIFSSKMVHTCSGCVSDGDVIGIHIASNWAAETLNESEGGEKMILTEPGISLEENVRELKEVKDAFWLSCLEEVFGNTLSLRIR